jgi:hypothetical protein
MQNSDDTKQSPIPERWRAIWYFPLIPFAIAIFLGLFIGYSAFTVIAWDTDNDFPNLYPHRTLVQWIEVNQVQHVKRMIHDLW